MGAFLAARGPIFYAGDRKGALRVPRQLASLMRVTMRFWGLFWPPGGPSSRILPSVFSSVSIMCQVDAMSLNHILYAAASNIIWFTCCEICDFSSSSLPQTASDILVGAYVGRGKINKHKCSAGFSLMVFLWAGWSSTLCGWAPWSWGAARVLGTRAWWYGTRAQPPGSPQLARSQSPPGGWPSNFPGVGLLIFPGLAC